MKYTGIKEVRKNNSDEFIRHFKRVTDIGIFSELGEFYKVRKMDVWEVALRANVSYYLTDDVYRNRRTVMVLR